MRRFHRLAGVVGEGTANGRGLGGASAGRHTRGRDIGPVGAAHRREGIPAAGRIEREADRIHAAATNNVSDLLGVLGPCGARYHLVYCIV